MEGNYKARLYPHSGYKMTWIKLIIEHICLSQSLWGLTLTLKNCNDKKEKRGRANWEKCPRCSHWSTVVYIYIIIIYIIIIIIIKVGVPNSFSETNLDAPYLKWTVVNNQHSWWCCSVPFVLSTKKLRNFNLKKLTACLVLHLFLVLINKTNPPHLQV